MDRVTHFIRDYLAPTETFVENQITSLTRFEPLVVCRHKYPGQSYDNGMVTSVDEILSPLSRRAEAFAYTPFRKLTPLAAKEIVRQMRSRSVRLFHFHFLVDARFFLPVIQRMKVPKVVSGYGYDVSSFPLVWHGYGLRYLHPIFDEIDLFLAMSNDMKKDLVSLGCPASKIMVHYHGIDVMRFLFPERKYSQAKRINLLVCASLKRKKGHRLILQALRKIEQAGMTTVSVQATFVGDGPLRHELHAEALELGLEDRVVFKGHIPHHEPELVQEYRKADIFALPSITADGEKEGIPGTLVEAMASGLPVISTWHAGIPEVITDGQNGKLVNEGDIESIAALIVQLASSPELRRSLGQAAAMRAKNELDIRIKTTELEGIYDGLLLKRDPSGNHGEFMRKQTATGAQSPR